MVLYQGHLVSIMIEVKVATRVEKSQTYPIPIPKEEEEEEVQILLNQLFTVVEYITIIIQDICQEINNVLPLIFKKEITRLWSSFLLFCDAAPKDEMGRPIPAKRTSSLLKSSSMTMTRGMTRGSSVSSMTSLISTRGVTTLKRSFNIEE